MPQSMPQNLKNVNPPLQQDRIQLDDSWKKLLIDEFSKPYMQSLREFLLMERKKKKQIFPPGPNIFSALNSTPYEKVKVVILGQDPYHGVGQAHGLCFSVQQGVALPPSLQNIFKELRSDMNITIPTHGYLQSWAEQGVLLLNSVLTVEMNKAGAHQGKGWEKFTDRIVELLNMRHSPIVFLLWGNYALKKAALVDRSRHLVLEAPHPSPLSASRGFFGCKHFSQANAFLVQQGLLPIDWQIV